MNKQSNPLTLKLAFAMALLCASATGWAANPAPAPGIYQFGANPGTLNLTITQAGSTESCELIMDMDFQPAVGGVNLLMANAIIMPGTRVVPRCSSFRLGTASRRYPRHWRAVPCRPHLITS